MVARVIDKHVNAAEFVLCFFEKVDACCCIGYVHGEDFYPSFVTEIFGNSIQLFLAACDEQEIRAGLSEHSCGRGTDTLGSTRDNHSLVFEDHVRSLTGRAGGGYERTSRSRYSL